MKDFIRKLVPKFVLSWYHFFWAFTGALFYGFPGYKIKVIGVTGTKGKSSVVEILGKILETAGHKVALSSSLHFKIGQNIKPNLFKMTMPGRWFLQKFLRRAVKARCDYAVLEITSEGILQHRQRFINFKGVVLTNLSPEHIEAHGSFENYKKTKAKLFHSLKKNGFASINLDDVNAQYFFNELPCQKIGYGLKKTNYLPFQEQNIKIISPDNYKVALDFIEFHFHKLNFKSYLLGEFNLYNILAALSAAQELGVDLKNYQRAIEGLAKISGRLEFIETGRNFDIVVDYAHTPDSLEAVYKTLKPLCQKRNRKLLCLLGGTGGGRDKWKRPIMGLIAARYCDEIIFTNEDPYNENPSQIIDEVMTGAEKYVKENKKPVKVHKVIDRRNAIKLILELAEKDDVCALTGKGSEPWMVIENNKKMPWNEPELVKELTKHKTKPQ